MAGEEIEIIIDANGLARTEQVFRSLDRYMERLHVRASRLGRIQIRPVVQLIDRVTEPLERIKNALIAISSASWTSVIELNPKMDSTIFATKGAEAGRAFSDSFLAEFDSDKLADKVKESLEGISVNVNVNPSDGDGSSALQKAGDIALSVGTGVMGSAIWSLLERKLRIKFPKFWDTSKSSAGKQAPAPSNSRVPKSEQRKINRQKRREARSLDNPTQSGSGKLGNAQRRSGKKGNRTSPLPSVPSVNNPPEPKGSRIGKAFGSAKKVLSNLGGPKVNSITAQSAGKNPGISAGALIGKGTAKAAGSVLKSALKIGGRFVAPIALASGALSIFSSKPGMERNKAIGGAIGDWGGMAAGAAAGAAFGSVIPVVGTAIGGLVGGAIGGFGGSAVGEKIGELATKASDAFNDVGGKIKGLFFGSKKKEKEPDQLALPTPAPVYPTGPAQLNSVPTSMPISVNVPYGAIQITVNNADIDYEQITNRIGGQLASSIQQAVENRV